MIKRQIKIKGLDKDQDTNGKAESDEAKKNRLTYRDFDTDEKTEAKRQTERPTYRQKDKETKRQTERHCHRDRQRHCHRERQRDIFIETDRETLS
jgi:hypothetical protein